VRLLVDENLSPRLIPLLVDQGHDAVHVAELGLASASDEDVFAAAVQSNRTILSADTDFGTLLASTKAEAPSVILLRRQSNRSVPEVAALIQANIDAIADPIEAGSVVVLEESRIRIRQLPLA
jgi:predicted nuclease of predicted toxin-antitoxin system